MKKQAVQVAMSPLCVLMALSTSARASAAIYPLARNTPMSMQVATRSQTLKLTERASDCALFSLCLSASVIRSLVQGAARNAVI